MSAALLANSTSSASATRATNAEAFAAQLARGDIIAAPAALVVAHPDDEVLGCGSRLQRVPFLTLIHLTDGSPRALDDAARAGFADANAYAQARRRELADALRSLDVEPRQRIAYGATDGDALNQMVSLVMQLKRDLVRVAVVITHTYEHGHPDHDTAACAVHAACALLRRERGTAPGIVEFPSYHRAAAGEVFGEFFAADAGDHRAMLNAAERLHKTRALACFATQAETIARFPTAAETFRAAPAYDFSRPAPPRRSFYDALGWPITAERWRDRAAAALAVLGLSGDL